jgi:hypothetical protein
MQNLIFQKSFLISNFAFLIEKNMPSGKDSKTNFALLRNKILEPKRKEYWRSVEEFVDAPEFEEFVKTNIRSTPKTGKTD